MSDTSTRVWAGLFVLLVFVAGFAAGVVVRPWLGPDPGPSRGAGPRGLVGGPAPARMTERLLERISVDIDLTPEQDERLRAVFDGRRQRLREINEEVRGLFEFQQVEMSSEIAAILTPEQMEIFENEIVRMRRPRGGPPGRGGRPGRGGLRGRPRRGPAP
jgi:Spy/CpxP family protein refolding chaperone